MSIENIAVLIGALGGFKLIEYLVGMFVNRRSKRRKENADADIAEQEADNAIIRSYEERLKSMSEQHDKAVHSYEERLKELRSSNVELNTQLLNCVKEKARKDEIIDDKTIQIRKVNEKLVDAVRITAKLTREVQYYKNWKCFREYGRGKGECLRREPQQNPPLKYSPFDGAADKPDD